MSIPSDFSPSVGLVLGSGLGRFVDQVEVLFEEMTERDGKNYVTGHTKEYLRIGVPCEPEQADRWTNQLKEIELTSLSQIMH